MLKGHVFNKQLFEHPIFALFINTFLNGKNGVSNNYKNGMNIVFLGSDITIQSGAVCIQGRFLEEDATTTLAAGTDSAYCKLVIEIDLDKQNTESDFLQANYKIVKSTTSYPNLIQNNIVKDNAGVYQYELARFRTTGSGITNFQDMRTFLDLSSIYTKIENMFLELEEEKKTEYETMLQQLREELNEVEDESIYFLANNIATIDILIDGKSGNFTSRNSYAINYPQNFTKNNCCIINLEKNTSTDWSSVLGGASVHLTNDFIEISAIAEGERYRLTLIKL